jgi:cold shock CspA family protein
MAKSQETWNKKEAEKNRQKKKKDKEQKKMDRRASAKGGSSLDDMIAYVDENGRITSTPPDPKNKKVIKEEDIVISVPKKANIDPASSIRKGTVTFFNESKGYGFIKDHESQDSIFVHANGLVDQVKENSKVSFEVEMGKKGLNAVNVKLIP